MPTNREKVAAAVKQNAGKRLLSEIEYYLETFSDAELYETADAFHDAMSLAEGNGERSLVRNCVDVLIAAGFYVPRRGEVVISGRDQSPTRGGVKYDAAAPWCVWIDQG